MEKDFLVAIETDNSYSIHRIAVRLTNVGTMSGQVPFGASFLEYRIKRIISKLKRELTILDEQSTHVLFGYTDTWEEKNG